jgi:tetratricopeptide (TPR) repeat protein
MMDPLTQALVELAAIRKDGVPTQESFEALEYAYQVCLDQGHLLAGFEIAYRLAIASQARQHVARSERWYKAAEECAKKGKFRHGELSSLLGVYQCSLLDSGTPYGAEKQRAIISTLESHIECELGLATVGLNLSAIFQTSGQYKKGEEFSRKLEVFFNERGLLKQAGQAAFSEGACSAGLGDWTAAYDGWKRAMSYDVQAGDEISAAERKGAMAQAIAMDEFSKSKTISPEGMKNVRELLDSASRALATTVSNPEHIKAEAKILQTYAQLSIIGQVPVEGLKHLQRARNLYLALEMSREAALMDALSGLALLEVAKRGSPQMYEEAGHSLQRALNYFSLVEHTPIRWKIKYYLALSAYFHSQTKPRDEDKMQWRATAAEWLRDALADSELVRRGEVSHAAHGESDFSPGLGPEAMDPLKVVLGLVPGAALAGKRTKGGISKKRVPRQLH